MQADLGAHSTQVELANCTLSAEKARSSLTGLNRIEIIWQHRAGVADDVDIVSLLLEDYELKLNRLASKGREAV